MLILKVTLYPFGYSNFWKESINLAYIQGEGSKYTGDEYQEVRIIGVILEAAYHVK